MRGFDGPVKRGTHHFTNCQQKMLVDYLLRYSPFTQPTYCHHNLRLSHIPSVRAHTGAGILLPFACFTFLETRTSDDLASTAELFSSLAERNTELAYISFARSYQDQHHLRHTRLRHLGVETPALLISPTGASLRIVRVIVQLIVRDVL